MCINYLKFISKNKWTQNLKKILIIIGFPDHFLKLSPAYWFLKRNKSNKLLVRRGHTLQFLFQCYPSRAILHSASILMILLTKILAGRYFNKDELTLQLQCIPQSVIPIGLNTRFRNSHDEALSDYKSIMDCGVGAGAYSGKLGLALFLCLEKDISTFSPKRKF